MNTRISAILAVILAATLSFTGCIKETYPMGSTQREDQVTGSELALSGMVNGIPAAMMRANTSGYYSTYGTQIDFGMPAIHIALDCMLEDLALVGNFNAFQFYFYAYNIGQGDDEWPVAYFWDSYYMWVKLCNDVIRTIDPETATDEMLGYLGQAYAYRAMCYLDLARLHEPKVVTGVPNYEVPESILGLTVPIVRENTTEEEAMNNPRATREALYAFIFEDLSKAEEYLAGHEYDFSKPTLGAVYGLYARAWLEMGYWTANNGTAAADETGDADAFRNAAQYARKAITESGKTPLTKEQWTDPSNGFNSGSSNNSWIWGLRVASEQINNLVQFSAHMSTEALWGYGPMSQPAVNKRLFDQIPDSDFRKLTWLDPQWKEFGTGTKEIDYSFAGSESDHQLFLAGDINEGGNAYPAAPYESLKFRPVMGEMTDYVTGGPADHPLMRVEEMYFIEMEATAHYDLNGAVNLLNTFMDYRITDGSYDCAEDVNGQLRGFIDEMMLQKRIEFWGEGLLIYDYKRLDRGITRYYDGSNHPSIWQFNTPGRSPQWNLTISTVGEMQSNIGINQSVNNPDPSGTLVVPE